MSVRKVAEYVAIRDYVTKTYPSGVVSVISDSFDFWTVITKIAPKLKQEILNRTPDSLGLAKVVFRPDSGDPVKILCGMPYTEVDSLDYFNLMDVETDVVKCCGDYYEVIPEDTGWTTEFKITQIDECVVKGAVECLADIFGTTTNEKGYKTLNPRVGLIYGDSITLQRADEILKQLAAKGFASDNVVFGIGSYTFQYNTRDTFGFAMKATYVEVQGKGQAIFKEPKTDDGMKKSAKGLLQVVSENGTLKLNNDVTPYDETKGELRLVYLNGIIMRTETFADIRTRLNAI